MQSKADAFEYADQVLERWYPSVEEGNDKGIVVLVTSQKEGAVTGGPAFVQAVGESILDATVSENLPGNLEFSSHSFNWHMIIPLLSATSSVRTMVLTMRILNSIKVWLKKMFFINHGEKIEFRYYINTL